MAFLIKLLNLKSNNNFDGLPLNFRIMYKMSMGIITLFLRLRLTIVKVLWNMKKTIREVL